MYSQRKKMPKPKAKVIYMPLAPHWLTTNQRTRINIQLVRKRKELFNMGMLPAIVDIALKALRHLLVEEVIPPWHQISELYP